MRSVLGVVAAAVASGGCCFGVGLVLVAWCAAGSGVRGVEWCAACCGAEGVVDDCCVSCAVWAADLADIAVALEDFVVGVVAMRVCRSRRLRCCVVRLPILIVWCVRGSSGRG
jgi:hypothetical protein